LLRPPVFIVITPVLGHLSPPEIHIVPWTMCWDLENYHHSISTIQHATYLASSGGKPGCLPSLTSLCILTHMAHARNNCEFDLSSGIKRNISDHTRSLEECCTAGQETIGPGRKATGQLPPVLKHTLWYL
jgi:hypothetical protein